MTLGEKLQSLRAEAGLSQEDLAEHLAVSRQAVSKWELDKTVPDVKYIVALSDLFGVTTDYLLGLSESKRGFEDAVGIKGDLPSDSELNTLTIFRVAGKLRKFLTFPQERSDSTIDSLHRIYSLMMYRIIIAETAKGNLPSDWVPNADMLNDPAYLHILDRIESELITQGSHSPRRAPAKMPMSFRTVIDQTQSFVESRCKKSGIKLDGGYTTKF